MNTQPASQRPPRRSHRSNPDNFLENDIIFEKGYPLAAVAAEENMKPEVASVESTGKPLRVPYLTPGGTLVIPFASDPKYHWWKGGQSVEQTRAEVRLWMAAASADQSKACEPASRKDEVV